MLVYHVCMSLRVFRLTDPLSRPAKIHSQLQKEICFMRSQTGNRTPASGELSDDKPKY